MHLLVQYIPVLNPKLKLKIPQAVIPFITEEIEQLLTTNYADRFEALEYFIVHIGIRGRQTALEVTHNTDIEKQGHKNYSIYFPYEELSNASNLLEIFLNYVFEGLIIVMQNYDIPESSLQTLLAEIKQEVLDNPAYAYPKPAPTYEDLQQLLKVKGVTDKEAYRKTILDKLKARNHHKLKWSTPNDRLHTRIFEVPNVLISQDDLITLKDNELPLLECHLPNDNYFLMTTDYVYSYFMHYLSMFSYHSLKSFHSSVQGFNDPKLGNKTELHTLSWGVKSLFLFEIDSGDPGHYAKELFRVILERDDISLTL